MNKKEISILTALVLTVVLSWGADCILRAEQIRHNTLRLHIIANSNSPTDQQLKLEVRDEILKAQLLTGQRAASFAEAVKTTQENLPRIEENINRFIREKGGDYGAECSIEEYYFNTTYYSGFALPKGQYTALTVKLGRAEGKNWWCVVYPALCSAGCGELPEGTDSFIKTDRITPRFKIVELYEDIKNALSAEKREVYSKI